jgi:hypothetical protein
MVSGLIRYNCLACYVVSDDLRCYKGCELLRDDHVSIST